MKKLAMIFIGMLFAATQVAAKTLELVTLQYPPYQYEEQGEIKGFVVDILAEAFRRLQQPINITLLPWARAIKMIEDGTADAIFTAYKNAERETFADFSTEILIPQTVSLFVLKASPITFDGDLEKIANYNFGGVRKVSYGKKFDEAVNRGAIQLNLANTGEQSIEQLLRKRFDILVSNRHGALYILRQRGLLAQVRELSPAVESVPSYIAFSKKQNLTSLRDRFDAVLAQMKRDGTYERIITHYAR